MNNDIWNKVLSNIKNELSSLSFNTWFKEIEFIDIQDSTIRILVPYILYKNHLEKNYQQLIINTFNLFSDNPCNNIIFILKENFEDLIKTEKNNKENSKITGENLSDKIFCSNLRKNYTFDNFVVGETNKFAQAAALAVAENPGTLYNPLFIYGNSGLGKTHLMHAIGNYIEENTLKRVLYVDSDQFITDFIGLSRKNDNNNLDYMEYFKGKYRNIDVLIMDDIQFLGTASKSQQEFFHTFNNLYNDNKQIIISSDRSPNDLNILEDRLRTRFCWGLTVNIYPPDYNLKIAIIQKKIRANILKCDISDNVISYIASNMGNDVRQLEGAITRLIAYSTMMGGCNIDLNLAMEALKDFINRGVVTDQNNIRKIQKIVAEYYKISFEDIKSKKRTNSVAIPRQVAMYLCRKLTDESFPRIGIEFGGKDHATVMHACNKIENEIKKDKNLSDSIQNIEKQLQ